MNNWSKVRSRGMGIVAGLIGAVLSLGGCTPKITQESIKDFPLKEIRKQLDAQKQQKEPSLIVLIDARSPRAFAEGHIPDARNLTLADFPDRTDRRSDLDRRITRYDYKVVYGDDPGSIAAQALVKRMLGLGYEDVYMFRGGLLEWRSAGLPIGSLTPSASSPADGHSP
ncbi:MAG: rhodanese-like domain-containing protein [Phycisphaerales bacterium]